LPPVRFPLPLRFSPTRAATSKSCRRRHAGPPATGPVQNGQRSPQLPNLPHPVANSRRRPPDSAEKLPDFGRFFQASFSFVS
ncbi:unnamed protein product, partial [Prunus brigantina]